MSGWKRFRAGLVEALGAPLGREGFGYALLNSDPTGECIHQGILPLRCHHGLILARRVGRPDYQRVKAIYTERLEALSEGFYLANFLKLCDQLESGPQVG